MNYPKRHISIRVPWHDTAWDGRVCSNPSQNSSCIALSRIWQDKNNIAEEKNAGRLFNDMPEKDRPPCVSERAAFMSNSDYTRTADHPYQNSSPDTHGHFAKTTLHHPSYSAPAVPFYWMLKKSTEDIKKEYDPNLDVHDDTVPGLFHTAWVQNKANQKALLDCFYGHIKPEESLCFFYAKQVPFVEDLGAKQVLIGVGRVLSLSPYTEYEYNTSDLEGKVRSMLWERMVRHSIRPDFKDGFLLPYHAAIKKAEEYKEFDPASILAFSPDDRKREFSYASELVTHDAAIACLLSCLSSLEKSQGIFQGDREKCLDWIDQRFGELWKARGPCPGLASALRAFGINMGSFIAQFISDKIGENADPWILVDKALNEPNKYLPENLVKGIGIEIQAKWKRLSTERRDLLKLISRFEIDSEQATNIFIPEEREKANIKVSDKEILSNPYLLYEKTRLEFSPISIWTVDKGVFPNEIVREHHPLPEPTAVESGTDARRVCALLVNNLEDKAIKGDSLIHQKQFIMAIRDLDINPVCKIDGDLINVVKNKFTDSLVEIPLEENEPVFQLSRLKEVEEIIRSEIQKRIKGTRLEVDADWRELLNKRFDKDNKDELEEIARHEKTAALKELAESRFSVLVGGAGTGKTTILSILCSCKEIKKDGILLLAPTGKARVRMQQLIGHTGKTIAQFLTPKDRFDVFTGRYKLSNRPSEHEAGTVIIDEASMLTEEMLAATIDALKGVKRLILVGDDGQLPPIGTGRPFYDIIRYLNPDDSSQKFPDVTYGSARLTIQRRQTGKERRDMQLAEWFSSSSNIITEDDIFDDAFDAIDDTHLSFVSWNNKQDLEEKLILILTKELKLNSKDDVEKFDESLGGKNYQPDYDMSYFNRGGADKCENWQILSPTKLGISGVPNINRFIHNLFRKGALISAEKKSYRRIPKPKGPEKIVYGDKVINLSNTNPKQSFYKHRKVYPQKDDPYIANGEIGMVVGLFYSNEIKNSENLKFLKDKRNTIQVEFSSQPNFIYDFIEKDFTEDGASALELAYALTVHKSQGSEFETVILVLPELSHQISKELLYTALTRQKDRVVILHQGEKSSLKKYSSHYHSETARRLTNLFEASTPIEFKDRFFDNNLIYKTGNGEMVRSKSELIIADRLKDLNIDYMYEKVLSIGGATKSPDFTIEDMASGKIFYWEHCGMLSVSSYRQRWEKKLKWYKDNGIIPYEEGEGENGILIVTEETAGSGLSSPHIEEIIRSVILGES